MAIGIEGRPEARGKWEGTETSRAEPCGQCGEWPHGRTAADCGDGDDGGEAAGAAAVAFLGIRLSLESSSG